MNQQTRVKQIQVRNEAVKHIQPEKSTAEWMDLSQKPKSTFVFQADKLIRNLAVAGGLLLVVVAVKNAGIPESQSVFSALQASVNADWDESVGKLSFVSALLPEGLQEVWNAQDNVAVYAPIAGQTVKTWTAQEPYIEVAGSVTDVRAVADGEIMSVAHGMDEERIVRIRHDDGTESVYGNLLVCYREVGDRVTTGDIFARVPENEPLAFELRKNGRSIDPEGLMLPQPD